MSLSVEELSCPVCCEIYRSPVFLSCSHSICKDCLQDFWRSKRTQECPVCRRRSSKTDPPGNLVLKNLCEFFLNVEEVCDLHGEKLKLFCVEDKRSVCLVCRDSEKHNQHKFRTIGELLPAYKEELSNKLKSLQEMLKHTEDVKGECEEAVHHIQNFEATMERARGPQQEPHMSPAALIHMANHLGNLTFGVWLKMREFVQNAPVILDPNTAHPELKLSDDLTGLTWSTDTHTCPANPERFDVYPCVLGSEGFISGTHCWDVEVGDNTHWTVGITTASNPRKGFTFFGKDVWCVWHKNEEYFSYYQDQAYTPLSVKEKLQRVRVLLDWDRGKVSFSDPVTDTHLCSLTTTFTERLFPFFSSVCVTCGLRILPVKICATDQHS
ncbi:hypothetical protein cypCar_00033867 [Cyprinus carpio]|nr:hypothetical protein cypCar_00033867 [Cyprinus carpio]